MAPLLQISVVFSRGGQDQPRGYSIDAYRGGQLQSEKAGDLKQHLLAEVIGHVSMVIVADAAVEQVHHHTALNLPGEETAQYQLGERVRIDGGFEAIEGHAQQVALSVLRCIVDECTDGAGSFGCAIDEYRDLISVREIGFDRPRVDTETLNSVLQTKRRLL